MRAEGEEEFVASDADMSNNGNNYRSTNIGFINPAYAKKSRSDPRFATCTLEVGLGRTKLQANVIILCQASYFDDILTKTNMNERLYLPGLDPDAVNILIDYLYTGTLIYMEPATLQKVLVAAKRFRLDEVKTTCLENLANRLDLKNCLQIRTFAEQNNFVALSRAALEYVKDNLSTLTNSDEFVNLEYTHVLGMVFSCGPNKTTDDIIFKAILRWTKHSPANREVFISFLIAHMDLTTLLENSPELVMKSFRYETVLQGRICQARYHDMIEKFVVETVLEKQRSESQGSVNSVTAEPKQPNQNSKNTVNSSHTSKRSRMDRPPILESGTEQMETAGASKSSNQILRRKKQSCPDQKIYA